MKKNGRQIFFSLNDKEQVITCCMIEPRKNDDGEIMKFAENIHLYRKFGFTEIPVDKEKFPVEKTDIAFELYL